MPVLDQDTGQLLEHKQLRRHPKHKATWDTSYSNELGRLCQGIGHHPVHKHKKRIGGTDTFKPIQYRDIPNQRKGDVTYTEWSAKSARKKLTLTAAHHPRRRSHPVPRRLPEYARIKLSDIPGDFVQEYSLQDFAHNGYVYFEVSKGVYGLKQAGKLANDLLTQRLEMHGYYQCATTPGLWRHKWRPVLFVLIVDDFGIQYSDRRHAEHLLQALQQHYTVTTDWTGTKFAGIDIKWDYNKRTCRLTMDTYISALLLKYDHPDHALQASKRIQGIVGSLLYYARAVDNKLLVALSTISSQQTAATQNTAAAVHQLLDYVATYPSDGIACRASSMILAAHSDASYLTEPGSRSRAGAHIFLSEGDPVPGITCQSSQSPRSLSASWHLLLKQNLQPYTSLHAN
eukprot:CCRYP_020838-RA/>CCRYP_020838-RA protein AED:0.39 eAED:0.39 QI:0/0/0/1/1/1/3/0/399